MSEHSPPVAPHSSPIRARMQGALLNSVILERLLEEHVLPSDDSKEISRKSGLLISSKRYQRRAAALATRSDSGFCGESLF